MKKVKYLIVAMLFLFTCGCSKFQEADVYMYVGSVNDLVAYGDMEVTVKRLSDDICTSSKSCSKYQEFEIDVIVEYNGQKKEATLSTKEKNTVTFDGTKYYVFAAVDHNKLSIAFAK